MKSQLSRGIAGILGLILSTGVAMAQDQAPLEAYARMPLFRDIKLSPSGHRFFALVRPEGAEEYRFIVYDNGAEGIKPVYGTTQTDEIRFRNVTWKRDDRIIFSLRTNGSRYGTETVETRLFGLNPDDSKITPLFRKPDEGDLPVQIQDRIVSMLEDDADHILVQYWDEGRMAVRSVFTEKDSRHKTVMSGRNGIDFWSADKKGRIRSGWGIVNDKREKLIVRMPDDKWKDISHRVAEGAPYFNFLGFPDHPEKAFVASNHEGGLAALYIYDIVNDQFEEKLFESDVSDVYSVVQRDEDGAAVGVTFADETGDIHWFGANLAQDIIDRVRGAFPGHSVTLTSINGSDSHAVVYVEEGNNPGRYYIFDRAGPSLTSLPPQYPELADVPMGRTFVSSYQARDGLDIPAFVTLPPQYESLEDAKDLPFIVLPHGGPNARTFAGFDWEVQYLVSRGYGVLEMNFRGSSGYGEEFLRAGDRQWGQAMQDDITDGTNWLIEAGLASPQRIAIMGHSYGGYAALMGAVKTPDMYQCAIAHAPVTDLPMLIRHENQYEGGSYWTRRIGRLWGDREMLRDNSPTLQADKIQVPILLVHGEDDRRVTIDQSERMVSSLKRQDKEFRYVELEKGSHFLDVGDNRITFLKETDTFLKSCLDQ
ncbi:alpha/beta hydrolase family protein [Parvularcula marina]|uniref:S9 family peptidase n=1 Tax=Parvularcula marina TaxID=2292771 RepID=A0A371RFR3_9PROT|nr:S9 family peptidase [Parvularcula marina]RFB04292.1 S9 family peptidase [Parvularcula marina]